MSVVDYYVVAGPGILVEEFVRDRDHVTVGLQAVIWSVDAPRWLSCAKASRNMRADPRLLAHVTPVDRPRAEKAFRAAGGGTLPQETVLRAAFADRAPLGTAPPLRLGPDTGEIPEGFRERRVYRVLFAKDADSPPGGRRRIGTDVFSWEFRRVGGVAWALDVTVLLTTAADGAVGPMLRQLTDGARGHGLVPVTTERFV